MKKTVLLIAAVILLGLAWSFGWNYVAGKTESFLDAYQQKLAAQNRSLDCPGRAVSGFPFRISVQCDEVGFSDAETGLDFSAGALRSASQVYQPGKAVVEMDGPAQLVLPGGGRLDIAWASLRSSVTVGLSGADRFSVQGKDIDAQSAGGSVEAFELSELQAHGRRVDERDVDLAVRFRDMVSPSGRWPAFDFYANTRLNNSYDALKRRPDLLRLARQKGLSGTLHLLRYAPAGGGEVTVTGPFELDRSGVLDGIFEIEASKLTSLVASLREALPENREIWRNLANAAALLGGKDGAGKLKLKVTVKNSNASIGLIPLGRVPKLF